MTRRTHLTLALLPAAWLLACGSGEAPTPPDVSRGAQAPRSLGFVLVDFTFEQPDRPEGACPTGWNLNERDLYASQLSQDDPAAASKVPPGFDYVRASRAAKDDDPCALPERFEALPHNLAQGYTIAPGFDLDASNSTPDDPGPNACAHSDFSTPSGEPGVDNQLWTVLGCVEGYRRGGTIDEYALGNLREGRRTILVRLDGVDDLHNDDEVELAVYSSADPIPTDSQGALMDQASFSATDDDRFRNVMPARIRDGVITARSPDFQIDFDGQFLDSEFPLRDAQLRLEIGADGRLRGLIGGFWDIERFYDTYAKQASRLGVLTLGFRCPGMLGALRRQADAYPDPKSGACTAISTVFRLEGIPAFVIEAEPERVAELRL